VRKRLAGSGSRGSCASRRRSSPAQAPPGGAAGVDTGKSNARTDRPAAPAILERLETPPQSTASWSLHFETTRALQQLDPSPALIQLIQDAEEAAHPHSVYVFGTEPEVAAAEIRRHGVRAPDRPLRGGSAIGAPDDGDGPAPGVALAIACKARWSKTTPRARRSAVVLALDGDETCAGATRWPGQRGAHGESTSSTAPRNLRRETLRQDAGDRRARGHNRATRVGCTGAAQRAHRVDRHFATPAESTAPRWSGGYQA